MSIDRNSPLPLYYQLKQLLLAKIESGELQAGDMFPTEQQIQDEYDVSRTTVRQALGDLEEDQKITRHRGRGTFVAKPKVEHHPDQYPNLADHMTEQGVIPGWRLLSAEWVDVSQLIREKLAVDDVTKLFCLERLRLENDSPIGYHLAYVAPDYTGAIDESSYTEGGSLRYLRGLSVLAECIANRTLEAVSASQHIAALLNVQEETPLLRVSRTVYTPDERPVEHFIGWYRGDRFEYHINNMRAISGINA